MVGVDDQCVPACSIQYVLLRVAQVLARALLGPLPTFGR